MRRLTAQALAAVIAAALLGGCTSHGAVRQAGSSAKSSPSTDPSTSPSSSAALPAVDAAAIAVVPTDFSGGFSTPSGNISCYLDPGGVWCSAKHKPWKQLPVSAECRNERSQWDTTVQLFADQARPFFRGDCYPILDANGPALAYGHALQDGRVRCAVTEEGVDCVVVGTSKGFFISRTSYQLHARRTPLTLAPTPAHVPSTETKVPAGFDGGFHVPSWGLACALDDAHVECMVDEPTAWTAPPYRGHCDLDHAKEVALEAGRVGRAFTACRSDALGGARTLAYGHRLQVGDIRCTSQRSGLTCLDLRSGHGFTVSRQSFRGY